MADIGHPGERQVMAERPSFVYPQKRCTHPSEFVTRDVGRLCDQCLANMHLQWVGPLDDHQIMLDGRFSTSVARGRAMSRILGAAEPTPRDVEMVPVAAAVVALADDLGIPADEVIRSCLAHYRVILGGLPAPAESEILSYVDQVEEEASA